MLTRFLAGRAVVAVPLVVIAIACGGGATTSETVTELVPPSDTVTRAPDTLPSEDAGVAPVVDAGKIDSGACPPAILDTASIAAMHPPHQHAGMCTSAAQLDETVNRCVRGVGGSCGDWLADTSNYECQECLFSSVADTTWAPIVYLQGKRSMYNRGGAALLSGASPACADAVYRADMCLKTACTCAPTPTDACEKKAADVACKALGQARDTACDADKDILAGLDPFTGSGFYALFCP